MRRDEGLSSHARQELEAAAERVLIKYLFLIKEGYQKEFDELEALYNDPARMPGKIGLTETENLAFDQQRIGYVIKACLFIETYYAPGKTPFKALLDAPLEQEFLDGLVLVNTRQLLEHIGFTIFNFSGSVRANYKKLLSPAPFTWETFEHLGGIMKTAPPEWLSMTIRHVDGFVAKRLHDEYCAVETTVEAAIPDIVSHDISSLRLLFSFIQKKEAGEIKDDFEIKPVELVAIKALTRRIIDTESLIQLLKYADNHATELDHRKVVGKIKASGDEDKVYYVQIEDDDGRFERVVGLETLQGRHAALRRMEIVGELITGKCLSSFIKDLDPSIDWTALNLIRDVIAHQDEGDNSIKVQALLDDADLFRQVLGEEMQTFFLKLTVVVDLRDKQLPQFVEDPGIFWQSVYGYERNRHEALKAEVAAAESADTRRATDEAIEVMRAALESTSAPAEVIEQWVGILKGTLPMPDKIARGQLMRHFPSRKANKALNAKCKQIVQNAIKPRTTLASRDAKREQEKQAAALKEQQRQAQLSGLEGMRTLAASWQEKLEDAPPWSRLRRIDLAIEALENIKAFMEKDHFIKADFNFKTVAEWGEAQNTDTVMNFFARLVTSPVFNDAMEYNAAQLLQHLEAIREFPEAGGHRFLDKDRDYEMLRSLRNWVEHGNQLTDREEYDPGKEPSLLQGRQKVVGPIMITLIFELLPDLYAIREQYTLMHEVCVSPDNALLWSSVNTAPDDSDIKEHDINQPFGAGYGF